MTFNLVETRETFVLQRSDHVLILGYCMDRSTVGCAVEA